MLIQESTLNRESRVMFYNIKMLPCSNPLGSTLPLTVALKWGTVWTSTPIGIETGMVEVKCKFFVKQISSFQIWLFLVSVPVEEEAHTVPHFKAPVNCKVEGRGQEHAGTFT